MGHAKKNLVEITRQNTFSTVLVGSDHPKVGLGSDRLGLGSDRLGLGSDRGTQRNKITFMGGSSKGLVSRQLSANQLSVQ